MTLAATGAQAQETTDICGRTPQVRGAILALTPADDECGSVSVSEMANIQAFSTIPGPISLVKANIESLKSGDFHGLDSLVDIFLDENPLMELPAEIFSGLSKLETISLVKNDLNTLPAGVFAGLISLVNVRLNGNPGVPFRFTLRFDPETLDEDFTTASVKLVLREGAPREITVPLKVFGATLSADSLSLARGDIESAAVTVTRDDGGEHFALIQRRPELGGRDSWVRGLTIVRGPSIVIDAPRVRVKVFLEGALE